ncbi:MAG TPA: response regulator [Acidimicrobiales bacterium]|nr:response regulator [Acidimicrobiales bacterium]
MTFGRDGSSPARVKGVGSDLRRDQSVRFESGDGDPIGRLHILIVDDAGVNRQIGQRLLQRLGCQADVVGDGQEALSALAVVAYDVVLMDINMPNVNGIEATRQIRRLLPDGRQPVVVAVSGAISGEERERCLAAGIDDFLAKPLRLDALRQVLVRAHSGDRRRPMVRNRARMEAPEDGILDAEAFAELAAACLDTTPGYLLNLVEKYRRDAGMLIEEITAAGAASDFPLVQQAAHTLKGISSMFGALALPALCDRLAVIRSGTYELPAMIAAVSAEHERLLVAVASQIPE